MGSQLLCITIGWERCSPPLAVLLAAIAELEPKLISGHGYREFVRVPTELQRVHGAHRHDVATAGREQKGAGKVSVTQRNFLRKFKLQVWIAHAIRSVPLTQHSVPLTPHSVPLTHPGAASTQARSATRLFPAPRFPRRRAWRTPRRRRRPVRPCSLCYLARLVAVPPCSSSWPRR